MESGPRILIALLLVNERVAANSDDQARINTIAISKKDIDAAVVTQLLQCLLEVVCLFRSCDSLSNAGGNATGGTRTGVESGPRKSK